MQQDFSSNNKRIARNTLLLYFRMIIVLFVSLYTSRIILKALGVEDFGIYNAVGGMVAMLSMLTGSLSVATSRFITYELGNKNSKRRRDVFSMSINLMIIVSIVIVVFGETLGLWFLNNKMTIPETRCNAANIVYQLSLLTFVFNILSVPYNASIIAHEKMKIFAYVGVVEVVCKLAIALYLIDAFLDKLIVYSLLLLLLAILIRLFYASYCKKKLKECTYHFTWNLNLCKEMFTFAGWNFLGASTSILRDHGTNVMMNVFFGPAINASRGLSMQVNSAINSFVQNFIMAINPQITKSYAEDNIERTVFLALKGMKLSFLFLIIITFPVFFLTPFLLKLWIDVVPDHSVSFIRLILCFTLIESLSNPYITVIFAIGKLKKNQIIIGTLQVLSFFLTYLSYKLASVPEMAYFFAIITSAICFMVRLKILKELIDFPIMKAITILSKNIAPVTIIVAVSLFVAHVYNLDIIFSFRDFVFKLILSLLFIVIVVSFIGLSREESVYIWRLLKNKFIQPGHK